MQLQLKSRKHAKPEKWKALAETIKKNRNVTYEQYLPFTLKQQKREAVEIFHCGFIEQAEIEARRSNELNFTRHLYHQCD